MTLFHRILASLFVILVSAVPSSLRSETLSPTSLISPGPLTALHAKYDENCLACHELGKGVPDRKCLDCHKEIKERRLAKKGFHAQVQGKCFECHTDHKGKGYDIVKREQLKPPVFDHQATGFPRAGKHAQLECRTCHTTRSYLKLQPACASCHQDPHNKAFKDAPCTDCHSFEAWKPPVAFRHEKAKFKLEGPHKDAPCSACHAAGTYRGRKHDTCSECHKEPHNKQFEPTACSDCHTVNGKWTPDAFRHEKAKFQREGPHKDAPCSACHAAGTYRGRKHDTCSECHKEPHNKQFEPTACSDCHTVNGKWTPDAFRHEKAKFQREGPHKDAPCSACHAAGIYRGRKHDTCSECHKEPHNKQFEPTACSDCHTVNGKWTPDDFRHEKAKFRREGPHKDAPCSACHAAGTYRGRKHDTCAECHKDPHAGTRGPACTKCHRKDSWNLSAAVHTEGGFPLQGRHARLNCTDCHKDKTFAVAGRQCLSCHADPHRNQFGGTDCNKCHNAAAWIPPTFTHVQAGFVLDGRHRAIDCERCHVGRNYRNTPTQCENCHRADFLRTSSPSHPAAGIQGDCRICHNTSSWRGAIYNHRFYFLAGPHNNAMRCNDCHISTAVYNLIATRCTVCHRQPVHPGHTNPDGDMPDHTRPHLHGHEPCAQCHYTDTWKRTRQPHM